MARHQKDNDNQGKMSLSEAGKKGGEASKRKQGLSATSNTGKRSDESRNRQR